jgi:hypothetical protein
VSVLIVLTLVLRKMKKSRKLRTEAPHEYYQPYTPQEYQPSGDQDTTTPIYQRPLGFCPYCGFKLGTLKNFCPNCGKTLQFNE